MANPTESNIGPRIIELNARDILGALGSEGYFITDAEGAEVTTQLTYDSLILFRADVAPGTEATFTIHPADSITSYPATVWGQAYPKRRDDISYENELIGVRIYGPGTRQAGEKAFGYDIFFKHPTEELIVPQLYAPETDDAVWAKVDSLRAINPALADDFISSFSYHIDHGLGMDCYAVGATLGAGVAALAEGDTIFYPWTYERAEILDNGPLRFTLRLDFAPREAGAAGTVAEHRLISLDSQAHLNKTKVWFDGQAAPMEIVAGFPLRDETPPVTDPGRRFIAYSDPTQGPDNGRALLGITFPSPAEKNLSRDGHILMSRTLNPSDTLLYSWGFAWDRADIPSLDEWQAVLNNSSLNYNVTIK